jgi:hypothetical protein
VIQDVRPQAAAKTTAKVRQTFMPTRLLVKVVTSLLLVVLIGGGFLVYRAHHQPAKNLNDVKVIVAMVNRHYILPTDEQPALATVTDQSKLSTKFLQKAENGDKVLIYQKAARVIIYRPSVDRIVDVGPVQLTPLVPAEQAK